MGLKNRQHNDVSLKIKRKVDTILKIKAKWDTQEDLNEIAKAAKATKDVSTKMALAGRAAELLLGLSPYPVQYAAALELTNGRVIEMRTGEGKTLVAVLAATVLGQQKRHVQIVTVNEYLAQRDCDTMRPVYETFGLSVACIDSETTEQGKVSLYRADVVYITHAEAGFNYLRDNLQNNPNYQSSTQDFAIVDEADSVLLDDARTPLIIAGSGEDVSSLFQPADVFVKQLDPSDVRVDREHHSVDLTNSGMLKANRFFHLDNIYDTANKNLLFFISRSLHAHYLYQKGYDYLVKNNEIVLLDTSSGRISNGRRLSDGLHQAIEAKEGVKIQPDNQTVASITYQALFDLYTDFAGMTGTAYSARKEFQSIYHKRVVRIPSNKPSQVKYGEDRLFIDAQSKYAALAAKVQALHESGVPILVGTNDVNKAHTVAELLTAKGLEFQLLTAENDKLEAEIIAEAGQHGAITVATNMAGRGTDIKLDEQAKAKGGLAVLVDERSSSRRIDDQFAGRTGRQGQPGFVQFFVSYDDELMSIYLNRLARESLDKERQNNNVEIHDRHLLKHVRIAQKRWEGQNYDTRKNTVDFDQPIAQQRKVFYLTREHLLISSTPDILKKVLRNIEVSQDEWINLRPVLLSVMDHYWQRQLLTLEKLRQECSNVSYQQQQPIVVFTHRAKLAYRQMEHEILDAFNTVIKNHLDVEN